MGEETGLTAEQINETPYMPGMTLPDLQDPLTGQGDDPDWPVKVTG